MPVTDVEHFVARTFDPAFAPEFPAEPARAGSRQEATEILARLGASHGHVFSPEEALAFCEKARVILAPSPPVPPSSADDSILDGVRGGSSIFSGQPPTSPQSSPSTMDLLSQSLSGHVGGSSTLGGAGEPSGNVDVQRLVDMLNQLGPSSHGVSEPGNKTQDLMNNTITAWSQPGGG